MADANILKLRTRKGDLLDCFDFEGDDSLHVWISDNIPPMPEGQLCEQHEEIVSERNDEYDEDAPLSAPAEEPFYMWVIEGNHVCYTYLCSACYGSLGLDSCEAPAAAEYPTTVRGNAVAPTRCTS